MSTTIRVALSRLRRNGSPAGSSGSWAQKIFQTIPFGKAWGVPIRLHWSLPLLMVAVAWFGATKDQTSLEILLMMGMSFGSVFLHEFGHVGAARTLGISTYQVTLSALGGVASLSRMPTFARHEIWVTIAGPLVNVAIALVGFVLLLFTATPTDVGQAAQSTSISGTGLLGQLILINVLLFGFNLLPILPMDGGRLLRAVLRALVGGPRATEWAVWIGRAVIVGGLLYLIRSGANIGLLPLTAFFLWTAQRHELGQAAKAKGLRGRTADQLAEPLARPIRFDPAMGLPVIAPDTPLETLWWDLTGSHRGVTRFYLRDGDWLVATLTPRAIRQLQRQQAALADPASDAPTD